MDYWTNLSEPTELEQLLGAMSKDTLVFKHSSRCSISLAVKARLESTDLNQQFEVFLIDVVHSRPTSLYLAQKADIQHESPQVLLFRNGQCYFHASHFDITPQSILNAS